MAECHSWPSHLQADLAAVCQRDIKALPTGVPVSGPGFSVALTQAGRYLAT